MSSRIALHRSWRAILLILVMGSCAPAMPTSVLGPTSLAALESPDDALVVATLVRAMMITTSQRDATYPDLAVKAASIFGDSRRTMLVRALALASSNLSSAETIAVLKTPNLQPDLYIVAAFYLGTRGAVTGFQLDEIRSLLTNKGIAPVVRYALVAGLRSSFQQNGQLEELFLVLAGDVTLPSILRIALLDGAALPPKAQLDSLLKLLKDQEIGVRLAAAGVLKATEDQTPTDPRVTDALYAVARDPVTPEDLFATAIQALRLRPPQDVVDKAIDRYLSSTTAPPVRAACLRRLTTWHIWEDRLADPAISAILAGNDVTGNYQLLAQTTFHTASLAAVATALQRRGDAIRDELRTPRDAAIDKALLEWLASITKYSELRNALGGFTGELLTAIESYGTSRAWESPTGDEVAPPALGWALHAYVELAGDQAQVDLLRIVDTASVDERVRASVLRSLKKPDGFFLMKHTQADQPDAVRIAAIDVLATSSSMPGRDESLLARLAVDERAGRPVRAAAVLTLSKLHYHDMAYLLGLLRHVTGVACATHDDLLDSTFRALADAGDDAAVAVPALAALAVGDAATACRPRLTDTIAKIARSAELHQDTGALVGIRLALVAVPAATWAPTTHDTALLAVQHLEAVANKNADSPLYVLRHEYTLLFYALSYILAMCVISGLLFAIGPQWILRLSRAVPRIGRINLTSIGLGQVYVSMAVISTITVVTILRKRTRVLDTWTRAQRQRAQDIFSRIPTVTAHKLHVAAPASIEAGVPTTLELAELKKHTREHRSVFTITGGRGVGKSSLAFQIARWAMASKPQERLYEWIALPALINYELPEPTDTRTARDVILGEITTQIRALVDDEPAEDFIESLIRTRRILVIVDRFAELSDTTRTTIIEGCKGVPALVATTGRSDGFTSLRPVVIEPQKLRDSTLSAFVEAFLGPTLPHEPDPDVANKAPRVNMHCVELERLTGSVEINARLTTIYLRNVIADSTSKLAPATRLFQSYIDSAYGDTEHRYTLHETHEMLRKVAHACVSPTRPRTPARRGDIERILGANGDDRLAFLSYDLELVKIDGLGHDQIQLAFDPLAEQLSAQYVVAENIVGADRWDSFRWNRLVNALTTTLAIHPGMHSYSVALLNAVNDEAAGDVHANAVRDKLQSLVSSYSAKAGSGGAATSV